MGAYATGVTVVAAQHERAYAGMTLNSFTSVSLSPSLISISLAHGSRTLEVVQASGRFAVSILAASQQEVALSFATRGAPFPHEHVELHDDGHVCVRDAAAVLSCELAQTLTAGDHEILIGAVTAFAGGPGEALVFHAGAFRRVDVLDQVA